MSSSFLLSIVFVIFLISTTAQAATSNNNQCKPNLAEHDICHGTVTVPNNCKSSTLNLSGSKIAKSCNQTVQIFWTIL